MTTPLTPTTAGLLQGLRAQLNADVENAKNEIQEKVGAVVTEMHSKIREVDNGLLKLTEAGKAIMDKIEAEKAETITHIQTFVADAASEFGKHRSVIEGVAQEVGRMQKDVTSMTTGLREELDQIKSQLGSVQATVASRGPAAARDSELWAEVEKLKGELQYLKLSDASRGPAAARVDGGGKLWGFIPWKQMTPPNNLDPRRNIGGSGSMRCGTTWMQSAQE